MNMRRWRFRIALMTTVKTIYARCKNSLYVGSNNFVEIKGSQPDFTKLTQHFRQNWDSKTRELVSSKKFFLHQFRQESWNPGFGVNLNKIGPVLSSDSTQWQKDKYIMCICYTLKVCKTILFRLRGSQNWYFRWKLKIGLFTITILSLCMYL